VIGVFSQDGLGMTLVVCRRELGIPIPDQKPERTDPLPQIHGQIAGGLGDPGPARMSSDTAKVHRPRCRGERLGKPVDLVTGMPSTSMTVTRYGRTTTVTVHERRCLWYCAFRSQPVRVLLVCEPRRPALALVTTDPTASAVEIIERYAARWSIEVAFHDAKHITGAGEPRNRTKLAVERTAPFAMLVQSLVIVWYHLAGHSPRVVDDGLRPSVPTAIGRNDHSLV
jgi:hypothetical protein